METAGIRKVGSIALSQACDDERQILPAAKQQPTLKEIFADAAKDFVSMGDALAESAKFVIGTAALFDPTFQTESGEGGLSRRVLHV